MWVLFPLDMVNEFLPLAWFWRDAGLGWLVTIVRWRWLVSSLVQTGFTVYAARSRFFQSVGSGDRLEVQAIGCALTSIALLFGAVDWAVYTHYGFRALIPLVRPCALTRPRPWMGAVLDLGAVLSFSAGLPALYALMILSRWLSKLFLQPDLLETLRSKPSTSEYVRRSRERAQGAGSPICRFMLVDALCQAERWGEAQAERERPGKDAHMWRADRSQEAWIALRRGQTARVLEMTNGGISPSRELLAIRAAALLAMGEHERALETARQAVELRSRMAERVMATVMQSRGDLEAALLWCERAQQRDGHWSDWLRCGELLHALGDWSEAIPPLTRGLVECQYLRPVELQLLAECHRTCGHEALADDLEQLADDCAREERLTSAG